jgi:hypothetical protein
MGAQVRAGCRAQPEARTSNTSRPMASRRDGRLDRRPAYILVAGDRQRRRSARRSGVAETRQNRRVEAAEGLIEDMRSARAKRAEEERERLGGVLLPTDRYRLAVRVSGPPRRREAGKCAVRATRLSTGRWRPHATANYAGMLRPILPGTGRPRASAQHLRPGIRHRARCRGGARADAPARPSRERHRRGRLLCPYNRRQPGQQ